MERVGQEPDGQPLGWYKDPEKTLLQVTGWEETGTHVEEWKRITRREKIKLNKPNNKPSFLLLTAPPHTLFKCQKASPMFSFPVGRKDFN